MEEDTVGGEALVCIVATGVCRSLEPTRTAGRLASHSFLGVRLKGSNHTDLRLEAERTFLSSSASTQVVIAVGIDHLAGDVFHHEPPTPVELEQAIDVFEDALMATGLPYIPRGELATSDPLLHALIGGTPASTLATLAEVETLFQRLAAISLGSRALITDPEFTRRSAAALLILRECMHHLGYEAVSVGTP